MSTASSQPQYIPLRVDNTHKLVRTRMFFRDRRDLCQFLADIVCLIEVEHTTGRLYLDFSEGHFNSAQLDESAVIEPS